MPMPSGSIGKLLKFHQQRQIVQETYFLTLLKQALFLTLFLFFDLLEQKI